MSFIFGFFYYSAYKRKVKKRIFFKNKWSEKIWVSLGTVDRNYFSGDCDILEKKNSYHRNWNELKLYQEFMFLIHDFTSQFHPTSFQSLAFHLLKYRFSFTVESSPGMGKTFLIFLWTLNVIWSSFGREKKNFQFQDILRIITSSQEFVEQSQKIFSKLKFFTKYKFIFEKTNKNNKPKIRFITARNLNFKTILVSFTVMKIRYFALVDFNDLDENFKVKGIKKIFSSSKTNKTQFIFFSSKKIFRKILNLVTVRYKKIVLDIRNFMLSFFFHQKFEVFRNIYDKIKRLFFLLKKKRKFLIILKSRVRCVFLSKIVRLYSKSLIELKKNYIRPEKTEDKSIISIGKSIFISNDIMFLEKFFYLFDYIINYDYPRNYHIVKKKTIFSGKNIKKTIIVHSFFLSSQKICFFNCLENAYFE